MTAAQLNELLAFNSLEPFGEYRSELRHGQQMALQLNLNRDPKQRHDPFNALECMNFTQKPPERVYTAEELEKYAAKIFGV